MSNIVELLLNTELEKIQRPTKQVEITRLSNILGEPFIVLCKGLTYDRYTQIQDNCLEISENGQPNIDLTKMQLETVLAGVYTVEGGKLFQNKDLQSKFKVPVAAELAKKLLLTGEISELSDVITGLTGYGENSIKQIEGL